MPAEHPSVAQFLRDELSNDEANHVGLVSFNQWSFTLGAICEIALAARDNGSLVTVAWWANETPLRDTGWTTHRSLARALGSASPDARAQQALQRAGFPRQAFAKPSLKPWHPQEPLPTLTSTRRDSIRELTYRNSAMGRSILQVHPDGETPIRDDYEWPRAYVHKAMESYAWVYDQTYALIQKRGITTIVVYNGRFTHDRAVAAAAQALGVRVLYYDTGGYETHFDLTPATTHDWEHLQQRMLQLYERLGDEGVSVGSEWFLDRQTHADSRNGFFVSEQVVGHIPELPPHQRLVVYFSSSGDEIVELELDWSEYLESQENALLHLAQACRERPGTVLVVRTHPHMRLKPADDLEQWLEAVERAAPGVHFGPESSVDSYSLMSRADVVFTYGSTSGVEAAFQGRPVAVMGPSAYDQLGCVRRITSVAEIGPSIDSPPEPHPERAVPYGLMMKCRGFPYTFGLQEPDGTPVFKSVRVAEANEFSRKISAYLQQRHVSRLT